MYQKQSPALAGTSALRRMFLAVLAATMLFAACVAVGTANVQVAWAADSASAQTEGKVTLQIVHGLNFDGSPQVVVNKQYDYYQDATVEDLLSAAKEAGDIKDFSLNDYGYLGSVTKADGTVAAGTADGALYWAYYQDGSYYSGSQDHKAEQLKAGTTYQFAWSSYPTATAPSTFPSTDSADSGKVAANQCDAELSSTESDCDPTAAPEGKATLQIIHGLDFAGGPNTVVNKQYDYYQDATVEDLLSAAKEAGDIKDFSLNDYGYLGSVTKADGTVAAGTADGALYWAYYQDGSYYSGSQDHKAEQLKAGTTYQFAWSSYPTATAPATWPAAGTDGTTIAGDAANGQEEPKTDDKTNTAAAVDKDMLCALLDNLKERYSTKAAEQRLPIEWIAIDLAAAGASSSLDAQAVTDAAVAAFNTPDGTNLQRSIIALSALGRDATALAANGTTYNLVEKMFDNGNSFSTIYGRTFALLALQSGSYSVPAGFDVTTSLINPLLATQIDDGGYAFDGTNSDADTTAMILVGLAPYAGENDQVKASIDKALVALRAMQRSDGGFAAAVTMSDVGGNASSTAMAVIAMATMGLDPAKDWAVESGATPLAALMSYANSEKTGFIYAGAESDISTEQAYRALLSYVGFQNKGAYNIYVDAKNADAAECADCKNDVPVAPSQPDPAKDNGEDTPRTTPTTTTSRNTTPTATTRTTAVPVGQGSTLQKSISNNRFMSINDAFSFTLTYTIPSGANTVTIYDDLNDVFECTSASATVGSTDASSLVSIAGQHVELKLDAAQYRGQRVVLTINVQVKNGTTLTATSGTVASVQNTGYVNVDGNTTSSNTIAAKFSVGSGSATRTGSASVTAATTAKTADAAPVALLSLLALVAAASAGVAATRRKDHAA